jgi:hypothetical protein
MFPADEPQAAPPPDETTNPETGKAEAISPHEDEPHAGAWPKLIGLIPTALVALVFGVAGAYVFERFLARPGDPNATRVAGRPEAGTVATEPAAADARPTSTAPVPALATDERPAGRPMDLGELTTRVDRNGDRIERVEKQVAERKEDTPPEVSALQVRIADLTEATNNLAAMPSKIERLDNRVSELSRMLDSVRDDVASLQTRVSPPITASSRATVRTARDLPAVEPPPASTVTSPAPIPDHRGRVDARTDNPEPFISRGAALFRRGRYKEAFGLFSQIGLDHPEDARVWYYAALSNGFSTNNWTNGTVDLVEKGIAREEAGTPRSPTIDAEFRDLTSANGKDWLAAYRKRVKPRRGS